MHTHTNLQTLSDDESPAGVQLCNICSGGNGDQTQQEGLYFLHHLKGIAVGISEGDYNNILHCKFHPQEGPFQRLLWFLCAVATLFRNNQGMSGSKLVGRLRGDSILTETEDPAEIHSQQHLVFSAIGWLSLLYKPVRISDQAVFKIDTQGAKYLSRNSINTEKVERPVDELLRAFGGEMLPKRVNPVLGSSPEIPPRKFQVSNINAAALHSLAQITFVWTDTISAHLDFDPTGPILYLFRLPSFCKMQQSEDSILST
jgi:hypothetical protein